MQNVRTRTIHLNQALVDAATTLPTLQAGPGRRAWSSEYRVLDVQLTDGRRYEGLLLVLDDMLLVPETEPVFEAEDIVAITATPPDWIPDFTVTEPVRPWTSARQSDAIGPNGSIAPFRRGSCTERR
jgi:hypothetical protein